jgi:hypothetical protein
MVGMFTMVLDLGCISGLTKVGMTVFVLCYLFGCIDFISSCIELFNKAMWQFPLFNDQYYRDNKHNRNTLFEWSRSLLCQKDKWCEHNP